MRAPDPAPLQLELELKPTPALYFAVGLEAGAVIALQICIMRIFSVGSWAHFGSLVVSLAMLGFGLTSAVMCIGKGWFERHWKGVATAALLAFGPLTVAANLLAQQIPFNAIFLVSDPTQKWRLFGNFMLYMLPFLAGALYLGIVFLKANRIFGRVYFADLSGAGLCGLAFLLAMYVARPENLIVVPLLLWSAGSLLWFDALANRRGMAWLALAALASIAAHFALPPLLDIPKLAVSDYKGVAYARKFPDAARVYESASPFGYLEIYASSYLHFAPGLSDNAAFTLPNMPANAYLGMYIDGEGPSGIIRDLPAEQTAYYRFLPMIYPYVIKSAPDTFVVQFGGGISTSVALRNSRSVTVAEGNPAVLAAFRTDKGLREFTGDVLHNPKLRVIDYDGRLYLAQTSERYDVIDLSLADSAGLSSPGGFAIVENTPIHAKRWRATCARSRAAACSRSRSGTRRSRRNRCSSSTRPWLRRHATSRAATSPSSFLSFRVICRPQLCSTSAAAFLPMRSRSCASTRVPCRLTRSTFPASRTISPRPPRCCRSTTIKSSPMAPPKPG